MADRKVCHFFDAMHIASLKTTNFRNLNGVELQFVPEVNVFHGLNGSGKTNLLEALHVCCLYGHRPMSIGWNVLFRKMIVARK